MVYPYYTPPRRPKIQNLGDFLHIDFYTREEFSRFLAELQELDIKVIKLVEYEYCSMHQRFEDTYMIVDKNGRIKILASVPAQQEER